MKPSIPEIKKSCFCSKKTGNLSISEKRSRLLIENNSHTLHAIKIDGGILNSSTTKKCDYLVIKSNKINTLDEKLLFIELKGSDIKMAIEQISETIKQLDTGNIPSQGVIIAAKRVPKEDSSTQRLRLEARKKHNINFYIKSSPHTVSVNSL